ncbi:MAG: hypothetical protein FJ387_21445 [Verrucomicrobia bacterium]|nr:hypothetical protein [Verrucomicrobiota bacterium]
MNDPVYQGFLMRQFEEATALARQSDVLELAPQDGRPPNRYLAHFQCKGLVRDGSGGPVEFNHLLVGIWLPEDYLRQVNPGQVLTYLGPAPQPWHPQIRPPFICAHIPPGTRLTDVLHTLYDLWTYNLVAVGDNGLNPDAAAWYRQQHPSRFPLERRPLKRRTLELSAEPIHPTNSAAPA